MRRSRCASSRWCALRADRSRGGTVTENYEFSERGSTREIEEGTRLAPKFDADGLVTCVTTDAASGDLLMVAHMNAEAFARTIESGEAWYFSRSRRRRGGEGGRAGGRRPARPAPGGWGRGENPGAGGRAKEGRNRLDRRAGVREGALKQRG